MSKRSVQAAVGSLIAGTWLMIPGSASAAGHDPYAVMPASPVKTIDMSDVLRSPDNYRSAPQEQPQDLAKLGTGAQTTATPWTTPGKLPAGWVQLGEVVQLEEVAMGLKAIDPEPSAAWEDLEGNQYPRKGTLFLNFSGAKLLGGGSDNSAENKSSLARTGQYPAFSKSEATALAIIQAVKEDMAELGVRVVYDKRPNKTVPYTMAMVGGDWTDANLDSPAGGVAPGTDCEARFQRHVVYVFDDTASTVGQEAAHSWGLDHTIGGDRIMSYQAGSNKHFGDNCQTLCEEACQGANSIGCRSTHEKYCGVGSDQQNDMAELQFIFGTNAPDTSPPEVKFTSPMEGEVFPSGSDVKIVSEVDDDYGGVGWKLTVKQDGKILIDEVAYDSVESWLLAKIPDGAYEVTVEAEDHADHIVSETITFTVGVAGGSDSDGVPTTSDTDDSAESGGSEGSGSDESGSGSASGTAGTGKDDGGCRISPREGAPLGLLAPLVGLGLAWRARRRQREPLERRAPFAWTAARAAARRPPGRHWRHSRVRPSKPVM